MIILSDEHNWTGGNTAVAFGMFDGLHKGHQKLIDTVLKEADQSKLTSMVYTYSNHPMSIFAPDRVPPQLQTQQEKIEMLSCTGIEAAVLRKFDLFYSQQEPYEFVEMVLHCLHPKSVVIGFNFSFGKNGIGNPQMMREYGDRYGFKVTVVDAVSMEGNTVSSTYIRKALQRGDIANANKMLGYPYSVEIRVLSNTLGTAASHSLFFIDWPDEKVMPKPGTYVCSASIGNIASNIIVYIQRNILCSENERNIYILAPEFFSQVQGKKIRISFLKCIRNEDKLLNGDSKFEPPMEDYSLLLENE